MNPIEQLGGYEKAKEIVFDPLHPQMTHVSNDGCHWVNEEFSHIPEIQEQIPTMVRIKDIRKALLEYRRQHNVFEIDDLITHPSYDWKILKVHDPIKSENLLFAKTNDHVKHHWGHGLVFDDKYVVAVSYSECRHATDSEIKAGKRLELGK